MHIDILAMVRIFSFLIQVSEPESHVCMQSYQVISVFVVEFPRGS